ncbi:MAG: hypothetical protein HZA49_03610 [Planctomycetes bacterium]|nr:hypothetical protein [Planctomycetota bacterium]
MSTNCLFCNQQTKETRRWPDTAVYVYQCDSCGKYLASDVFKISLGAISPEDKTRIASYLMSRYLTEKSPLALTDKKPSQNDFNGIPFITIDEILDQFPKRVDKKLNRALQNLGKLSMHFGQPIIVDYELPAIFYAVNMQEFTAVLEALKELDYTRETTRQGSRRTIYITAKGFDRIYELDKVNPESRQGFVAMWFDSSMDNVYKNGFQKAITDAGYEPRRIDKKEFLGKIDDEIIAEIKRSRFLVADFTGQRGGVYFEAGFAQGLDIPVIYTCRQDCMKDAHFDTRQYKHIDWKDEADLYNQLYNRIGATIGWGPQAKKEEAKQVK